MIKNILISCGYIFGFSFALVLSLFLEPVTYWPYVFGFLFVIICLQQFLLVWVYPFETPKYLISCGRYAEARELIAEIY